MKKFITILCFSLAVATDCFSQSKDLLDEWSYTDGIEGPATDKKGNLYAVNYQKNGTIGIVTPDNKASVYSTLPEGSIGNGIRFDKEGRMFVADYAKHNILMITNNGANVEVYAHNENMNQPNDIAIAPNGNIYASDPNFKEGTGNLWLINKQRDCILLEEGMGTTNGVEVSPDGKTLYVGESRKIWRYDIEDDGEVSNKQIFAEFDDFGLDGMRCDKKGYLYATRYGKGSVVILSPKGELKQEITLKGKRVSNITFSPNYKTCYVTMADRGCFEYFDAVSNIK